MKKFSKILPVLAGTIFAATTVWYLFPGTASSTASDVVIPAFSPLAAEGQALFKNNCATCHGQNGTGTKKGPPLLNTTYNPGHHGDGAFYRAVKQGVPQHHWPYGNMAPLPDISDYQISAIVRFVRELQEANGIVYKKHVM
ncbi:MAG TPA: c-type cytochrome [Rhizobiales bacterium]|nr:c-type cytochrome [Hyphomicrobiales bacterium]